MKRTLSIVLVTLFIAVSSVAIAGQRYEYKAVRFNVGVTKALKLDKHITKEITKYSPHGWRLITVESIKTKGITFLLIFERPIE